MKRRYQKRRATVLVAALVCLSVVMALVGHLLLGALRAQRELRRQRDLRQCELLLQAGHDRAQARRSEDADYRGESWTIPASELNDRGEARVTITIKATVPDKSGETHVVAEYPWGDAQSIRRSQTITNAMSATNEE